MKVTVKDILTANRKASREMELEDSTGFKSKSAVHVSKKTYNRKKKHSKKIDENLE